MRRNIIRISLDTSEEFHMSLRTGLFRLISMFVIAASAFMFSCDEPQDSNNVYVAGWYNKGDIYYPCYWKNGTRVDLGSRSSTYSSIAVSGSDIFVAGNMNFQPTVWKNTASNKTTLETSFSMAMGIALSGNDVFVSGNYFLPSDIMIACYWVNGSRVELENVESLAHNMMIQNGDIYIAGAVGPIGSSVPCYWVNGSRVELANNTPTAFARSVFSTGNDVYAAGGADDANGSRRAVIWKNGVKTVLHNGDSEAFSVFVNGNDVYVAGHAWINGIRTACYWKNGVRTNLGDGSKHSDAYSVYFFGGNVYVSGDYIDNGKYACVWRNDKNNRYKLSDGGVTSHDAAGTSIFVTAK